MKKEQVLDLMNAIPLDFIEEADVQAPARGRRPSMVRTGLIAACLCLALVGTTFAAVRYFSVRAFSDGDQTGYLVYGDFVQYPVDMFSAQLLADCGSWDGGNLIQPHFDTLEEAQAYLGEDIPCVWPEQTFPIEADMGHQPISLCLWQDRDNDNKLEGVEAFYTARYVDSETGRWIEPYIELFIATEYLPVMDDENFGTMGGMFFEGSEYAVQRLEDYPMSNGATAGMVRVGYPWKDEIDYTYIANFVKNGIRYQVSTRSIGYPDSPEDIEADLKTILDLFP